MANIPGKARVVIIGGGVVGCSVAYHLTRQGWRDVVLLERKQLTSGTTWHAAGLIAQLRATQNMTRLAKYSQELYGALERAQRVLLAATCRIRESQVVLDLRGVRGQHRRALESGHRAREFAALERAAAPSVETRSLVRGASAEAEDQRECDRRESASPGAEHGVSLLPFVRGHRKRTG